MAKVGEGDPRWIVQERQDGANVNNWHWQERPLNERAHNDLKQKFTDLVLCNNTEGFDTIKIKECSEIDGDVTVAQRKGKIMCYFELKMTLKYTGTESGSGDEVSGKISIPDVDHDTFRDDDYAMTVAATSNGKAQTKAEQWVYQKGRKMVREVIQTYFEALFEEFNVGKKVGGPQPQQVAAKSPASPPSSSSTSSTSAPAPVKKTSAPSTGIPDHEKTSFEQTFIWRCPANELWTVLTDAPRASAYTRAPAKIEPRPNGVFEFMGGAMTGYFVDLEHPNKMSMQWRLSSWPSGVHSSVVISFTQEEAGATKMSFAQVGIPAGEMERVRSGWMCNFWDPIKMVFGFQYELK